jgi:hypothetical protein
MNQAPTQHRPADPKLMLATPLTGELSQMGEEERLALMQAHLDRLNEQIAALKTLLL